MPDSYKTIKGFSRGVFRDRGSKFIADAWPAEDIERIRELLDKTRKEFRDARHHCHAWVLGADRTRWRVSDDGEPSGTAGKPILGQINSHGLTDILIIVTRYFGGTLLGTGGLMNAYRKSAEEAITHAEIIIKNVSRSLMLEFPYGSLNDVMRIIKEENLHHAFPEIDLISRVSVNIDIADEAVIQERLLRIKGLRIINAGAV